MIYYFEFINLSWRAPANSITYQILFIAGLGLIIYAGLASGDVWKEFYQYFRESKFVSVFEFFGGWVDLATP